MEFGTPTSKPHKKPAEFYGPEEKQRIVRANYSLNPIDRPVFHSSAPYVYSRSAKSHSQHANRSACNGIFVSGAIELALHHQLQNTCNYVAATAGNTTHSNERVFLVFRRVLILSVNLHPSIRLNLIWWRLCRLTATATTTTSSQPTAARML